MDKPFVSKKSKKPEDLAAGDKAKPFGDPSDPIPVHDEAAVEKGKKGRRIQNASRSNSKKKKKPKEPDGDGKPAPQAMQKIIAKLRNEKQLADLHLKHYHMNPTNFRRRTSALGLPEDIYQLYEKV